MEIRSSNVYGGLDYFLSETKLIFTLSVNYEAGSIYNYVYTMIEIIILDRIGG